MSMFYAPGTRWRGVVRGDDRVTLDNRAALASIRASTVVLGKVNMANEMKIQLRQISASMSEATMGRHQVLIDKPTAKGGADAGPWAANCSLHRSEATS